MALSIGVYLNQSFYVGEDELKVTKIMDSNKFKVTLIGKFMNKEFTISDQQSIEIIPKVRMSAGVGSNLPQVRVVIDAPRHIMIHRKKENVDK